MCGSRILKCALAAAAVKFQAHLQRQLDPGKYATHAAALMWAVQVAGLSVATSFACDRSGELQPSSTSLDRDALLAAAAFPGIMGFETFDRVLFVLSISVVVGVVISAAAWGLR